MNMPSPRSVSALRGAQWLVNAYALFRLNPGVWVATVLVLMLAMIVSSAIPLIGPLVFGLVFPIFTAGLGRAARAADIGENLDLTQFTAGFRSSTADLVAIGGFYMVGQLMVVATMLGIGGSALYEGLSTGARPAPEVAVAATGRMALASIAGLLLLLPLLAATWFAPLLVFFNQQKALPALRASLAACLLNWKAFALYVAAIILTLVIARVVVGVLTVIPGIGPILALALVGAMVAVLVPVGFISFYTSYIDVFPEPDEVAAESAPADRVMLP